MKNIFQLWIIKENKTMSIIFGKFKENKDMTNELISIKRSIKWIDNKPQQPIKTKILVDAFFFFF